MALEVLRDQVLEGALPHVPFDGWSLAALRAGAADAGLEPDAVLRAFPEGPMAAVSHFLDWADRRMLADLEAQDLDSLRVPEKVSLAVRLRLEALAPHKEAVRRSMAVLSLPHNAPVAARALYRTVDAIWYAAGDRSTDYNFYTKRGLLAAVYSSTVLYWLNDSSEDHLATWAFLQRRLSNVAQIPKVRAKAEAMLRRPSGLAAGLRVMARRAGSRMRATS